jgi:hypothetical protein
MVATHPGNSSDSKNCFAPFALLILLSLSAAEMGIIWPSAAAVIATLLRVVSWALPEEYVGVSDDLHRVVYKYRKPGFVDQ